MSVSVGVAVGSKRKLTDHMDGKLIEDGTKVRSSSTQSMKGKPASFCMTQQGAAIVPLSAEALKKSVSWPGSASAATSMLSPTIYTDVNMDDLSYEEGILCSKFQQQSMLLLKHSVFRAQSAGVTKSLHGKACDLIAGAAHAFHCGKGTTILAMHLFDRALALTAVRKAEVTLLAATCLLIAAKLEEINPPYADELAYYCGKRFEKEDVYAMEQVLLPLFQCQVSVPSRYDFALRFCEAAALSQREKSLVVFLLELSFLDYNLNYFLPSKVAAGAIHLAIQMLRHNSRQALIWPARLERVTRCPERDLAEVVLRLRLLHWNCDAGPMCGILQRYSSEEHYGLADTPALPYSQVRFDCPGLVSKAEKELPEYAECKTLDKR